MKRAGRRAVPSWSHIVAGAAVACLACAAGPMAPRAGASGVDRSHAPHPAVVIGPEGGTEAWRNPASETELGDGARVRFLVDHVSVPHATMTVMNEELAPTGIPIHRHIHEDEILYVLSGHGSAVVGEGREAIPLAPGSVVYIPKGEWHGATNADPGEPMEILIVTNTSGKDGLADFFRRVSVRPGHPPLHLSRDEFLALFEEYGMEAPQD